jgi:hypothetical protein
MILALSTPAWSALSALGGALVGGFVTGAATLKIEQSRQTFESGERTKDRERDDAARAALVRGAARVMRLRFGEIATTMQTTIETRHWSPREFPAAASADEQKLVAAAATADEWGAVDAAEFAIGLVTQAREWDRGTTGATGLMTAPLDEGWNDAMLFAALDGARKADTALAKLAGDPPRNFPEPRRDSDRTAREADLKSGDDAR